MAVGGGAVAEFEEQRPRLFGIAYRMLGSAVDAQDAVQDTYLRWHHAERTTIATPAAWLTTVLTRLCLNLLTSARMRREAYLGPWLPDPVLTLDPALGPAETAEQRDSVSLALLMAMEHLTPAERAVVVLREAFGYSHRDVAAIIDESETNCRQLHSRARRKLAEQPAAPPRLNRADWTRLVERFLGAARDGDLAALEALLAEDVTSWADGGGTVFAARRPVHGRAIVARYLAGVTAGRYTDGLRIEIAEINAAPAALVWAGTRLTGVLALDIDSKGEICTIRMLVNPAKLAFLSRRHAALYRSGRSDLAVTPSTSPSTLSRSMGLPGHP